MANDERRPVKQGDLPSDIERLAGDTPASDPLTDSDRVQPGDAESRKARGNEEEHGREQAHRDEHEHGNPPHTSGKRISSPAFGSAVSGGALADPGPPKN